MPRRSGVELDWEQFTPLISYFTPQVAKEETSEFDLYSFSYRDILHNGTYTMEMPWLDEVSRMNPYTYNITMNADTAKKKGLKDGDLICLESSYGRKTTGYSEDHAGPAPQDHRHCRLLRRLGQGSSDRLRQGYQLQYSAGIGCQACLPGLLEPGNGHYGQGLQDRP